MNVNRARKPSFTLRAFASQENLKLWCGAQGIEGKTKTGQ